MVLLRRSTASLAWLVLAVVAGCATVPTLEPTGLRPSVRRPGSPGGLTQVTPRTQQTPPPVLLTVEQGNVLDSLKADGVQDILVDQSNLLSILWLNDTDDLLEHYHEIPGQLAVNVRQGTFSIVQTQALSGLSAVGQPMLDLEQVNHLVLVVHRKAPLPSGSIQQFNEITALDVQNGRWVRINQANRVTVILDAARLRDRETTFEDATSRTLGRILGIQDRSGRRPRFAATPPAAPAPASQLRMVNRWILVLGRDGMIRPYRHDPD
jgi:hypothetical protein